MNDFSAASSHPNGGYVVLLLIVMMIPSILYFISKIVRAPSPQTNKLPEVQYFITITPQKAKKLYKPLPQQRISTQVKTVQQPKPVKRKSVKHVAPIYVAPVVVAPIPSTSQQIIDDAIATLQILGHKKAEAKSIVTRLVSSKFYIDVQEVITDTYKKV